MEKRAACGRQSERNVGHGHSLSLSRMINNIHFNDVRNVSDGTECTQTPTHTEYLITSNRPSVTKQTTTSTRSYDDGRRQRDAMRCILCGGPCDVRITVETLCPSAMCHCVGRANERLMQTDISLPQIFTTMAMRRCYLFGTLATPPICVCFFVSCSVFL